MDFKQLHESDTPLMLCNVWDAISAKIAEESGFKAVGTSSDAVAQVLGYEDGENISVEEMLYFAERIKASTSLPVSIDFEGGYSEKAEEIVANLKKLIAMGISGVNLEDSIIREERMLDSAENFAEKLRVIKQELGDQLFINVRIDTFIMGVPNALDETIARIKKYEEAGADGIFVPFLTDAESIRTICQSTSLPVNILCMASSPDSETLASVGVRRISTGSFVLDKFKRDLAHNFDSVLKEKHIKALFEE